MPRSSTIGWDLGGAHAKAALVNGQGHVDRVVQVACPLWQGLDKLDAGIDQIMAAFGGESPHRHAVTMTGELVDLFPDRASGVHALVEAMLRRFPAGELSFYAGISGFLDPRAAQQSALQVASANWLASASWAAQQLAEGVLIDIGSTTTDLIPFTGGQVLAKATDDHQRLVAQTLLYTGLVRTPLMAIADKVPFGGEWVYLMAEHFATTADIYRLNGELPEEADLLPSADNGEKSVAGSTRRLARMLGLDDHAATGSGWGQIARYLAEQQLRRIEDACRRILSDPALSDSAPLVGAGVGRFLVERISRRLGRPYVGFESLVSGPAPWTAKAAECAPAVAVASLAKARAA